MISLGVLSLDDSWLMFHKIAFSNKDLHQRGDLEEIGRQLANKCKGLPLVAKTLGSHMRGKRSKEEWERVLFNSLWKLEDTEKGVLGPLLLSYNGRIRSCKMHDIVHDFAQSITKDVCFTIEGDEEVKIDFKRARQLSLIVKKTFLESVYEVKYLSFFNLDFWSSQTV